MDNWQEYAKCYTNPPPSFLDGSDIVEGLEIFFSKELYFKGKEFCSDCPVKQECLAEGLKPIPNYLNGTILPDGIWGGLTPRERRKLLKNFDKRLAELQERFQKQLRGEPDSTAS